MIIIKRTCLGTEQRIILDPPHNGIFAAYTAAEVQPIKGSPGDIADVGVFSDKTVFEFLESFELGYIDWGNNRQHAMKIIETFIY